MEQVVYSFWVKN